MASGNMTRMRTEKKPKKPSGPKRVSLSGPTILAATLAAGQAVGAGRQVLVARFVGTEVQGEAIVIGLLTGFFAAVLTFSAAWQLVQSERADPGLQSSLQGSAAIRGLLTTICFGVAGWVGLNWIDKSYLLPPLLLASLVPLIDGFQHLDAWKALKKKSYRPLAIVELSAPIGSVLAACIALTFTRSIWVISIVAVSGSVSRLLMTHLIATESWRGRIRIEDAKPILSFALPLIPAGLLAWINSQGDKLLLMSSEELPGLPEFTIGDLGAYGTVAGMIILPRGTIVKTMKATIVPVLSAAKGDAEKLQKSFRTVTGNVTDVIGWGIIVGAAIGTELFNIVLGSEYRLGSEVAPILILGMGLQTSRSLIYSTALAIGRTTTQLAGNLSRLSGLAIAYLALINGYGLVGIAISVPAGELLAVIVSMLWVEKAYGSGVLGFMSRILGFVTAASLVMIVPTILPTSEIPVKVAACCASLFFGGRAIMKMRRG